MLFQTMIFASCTSNSQLHPATVGRGGENLEARVAHGLGSLGGSTELGSTIPKPCHRQGNKKLFKLVVKAFGFTVHFLVLKYLGTPMIVQKCHPPASTSTAPVQLS